MNQIQFTNISSRKFLFPWTPQYMELSLRDRPSSFLSKTSGKSLNLLSFIQMGEHYPARVAKAKGSQSRYIHLWDRNLGQKFSKHESNEKPIHLQILEECGCKVLFHSSSQEKCGTLHCRTLINQAKGNVTSTQITLKANLTKGCFLWKPLHKYEFHVWGRSCSLPTDPLVLMRKRHIK